MIRTTTPNLGAGCSSVTQTNIRVMLHDWLADYNSFMTVALEDGITRLLRDYHKESYSSATQLFFLKSVQFAI
jgi:hypothetical protein